MKSRMHKLESDKKVSTGMQKFRMKMGHFLSPTAETLMEVVIAVGVLMLIIGPSAGLYVSSLRRSEVQRKMLVADQLAQEGVDMVRAIRDTNLIRYPSKKTSCWLTKPDYFDVNPAISNCDQNANLMLAGSYIISSTPMLGMFVTREGNENTLSETLNSQSDALYNLHKNAQGFFSYTPDDPATEYYREINITPTDIDNKDGNNAHNDNGADSILITSHVKFRIGSRVESATATSVLFSE